ncbi:hypothetical protein OROHE_026204 [Orobanche hederae]
MMKKRSDGGRRRSLIVESAVALDHLKSYMHIEANKEAHVKGPCLTNWLWCKALDFAALKHSPVSFFNEEKPKIVHSCWARVLSPHIQRILLQIMPSLPRRPGHQPTYLDHIRLWQHEWVEHGRHFGVTLDNYFEMIHFLYAHLSPDPLVMGLSPGSTLGVQDIQNSIQRNFGVKPGLHGTAVKGRKVHITEFRYCVDDRLEYMDNNIKIYSGDIKSLNDPVIVPM